MGRKYTKNKLVYGWGVNDVHYNVTRSEMANGKAKTVWVCPYYKKWASILKRCFDPKEHERSPTYKGCTVTEDWKYLSNFIKWVDSQPNRDWQECEPDKDLLSVGNKHYGPETVVFVSKMVNMFITDGGNARDNYMIGVSDSLRKKNPYRAQCSNPFIKGNGHIGCYPTEIEAHLAWQTKKHEYALQLADLQTEERIAKVLRERYAPDKDWSKISTRE